MLARNSVWTIACALLVCLMAADSVTAQKPRQRRKGRPRRPVDKLKVGDAAPDFTLKTLDGKSEVTLSSFQGKKPVMLVFGSYTWTSPFRRQVGALESLQKKYEEDAEIYLVYIREAHPSDGWAMKSNERAGIVFKQPKALKDRVDIAHQMCAKLKISLPCLIDKIDNKVGEAYAGWPDRLYVIGRDGKIVYKGGPGPRGFKPAEADEAMKKHLATLK